MDILSKLFGSRDRVKMMRIFLFNPEIVFSVDEIFYRTGVYRRLIDFELRVFEKAGLVRRKNFLKSARDADGHKRRGKGWILDRNFMYLKPLENLLIQQVLIKDDEIIKRLTPTVGKLKMLLIAGLFIQNDEGRVDLMIVADNIRKKAFNKAIKSFEAEIGKELRYAVFETSEFRYRIGMYDKLLRDISDYPHKIIFDRLGMENGQVKKE